MQIKERYKLKKENIINLNVSLPLMTYVVCLFLLVQWNLSNPTHQGTRGMCQIVQDVSNTQDLS